MPVALLAVTTLQGANVRLRPATEDDIPRLAEIRRNPEVHEHWRGGDDMVAAVKEDFAEDGVVAYAIELDDLVIGWIQWASEDEPDYRHAWMDIYIDPAIRGKGVGTDAVRTLARHLIDDHGYHRLTIDPAAHNAAAIRSYTKVGFRPIGIARSSERGPDGTWHDSLLMDLLAEELTD
jgi:aminoglycoside 6'-N-acetyltransferase